MRKGFALDYTDDETGMSLTGAWMHVEQLHFNPARKMHINVGIYANEAALDDGREPIFVRTHIVRNGEECFDAFQDASLLEADASLEKAVEDCLKVHFGVA